MRSTSQFGFSPPLGCKVAQIPPDSCLRKHLPIYLIPPWFCSCLALAGVSLEQGANFAEADGSPSVIDVQAGHWDADKLLLIGAYIRSLSGILYDAVWCSDLNQNVHCSSNNVHLYGALIIAGIFPVGHATRLPSSGFFFDAAIWRDNPVEPMDFRCAWPRRSIYPQPLPFWACHYIPFACAGF